MTNMICLVFWAINQESPTPGPWPSTGLQPVQNQPWKWWVSACVSEAAFVKAVRIHGNHPLSTPTLSLLPPQIH